MTDVWSDFGFMFLFLENGQFLLFFVCSFLLNYGYESLLKPAHKFKVNQCLLL